MTLAPGTRVGPYQIAALIGAGGMGEVYRATDTNLARQVAIKVLPQAVAADADRLARFDREARTLAALNHPNIATIYGIEKGEGTTALVMELVEGPTLADRITQGAIPADEALRIAGQIAEALDAAHEQGIIHRDLKPANIKVRDNGTVKVLDFGLAKAIEPAGVTAPGVSQSPTITTPAMTQAGIVLGTAAYMSPEQARGRSVDRRTDIWAFGCVLYEMLVGQRAFDGDDVSITFANVLKDDPKWSALPVDLPSPVRRLLRRCLEKDPRRRLAAISDARLELDEATATFGSESTLGHTAVSVVPFWKRALPWTTAAVGLVALVVSILYPRSAPTVAAPRLKMTLETSANENWTEPALSPDGTRIAFRTNAGILVRSLDALEGQLLKAGDVSGMAWSPDGGSLVFCDGGANELQRISIAGGTPQTIGSGCSPFRGAAWNTDGTILFGVAGRRIMRIAENGGTAAAISAAVGLHPTMLPDGRHYLFLTNAVESQGDERGTSRANVVRGTGARGQARGQGGAPANTAIYVGAVDSGDVLKITESSSQAQFTSSGHLVFVRGTTLMAQPFDATGLRTTGEAFPLASDVAITAVSRIAQFSTAPNGLIVYKTGSVGRTALTWFDRGGATLSVLTDADLQQDLAMSQDGQSVAATRVSPRTLQSPLWITDLSRGVATPLTPDTDNIQFPAWSPDGTRVAYVVNQSIVVSDAHGSGTREVLARGSMPGWSPDGKTIVFSDRSPVGSLQIVATEGDHTPTAFLAGRFAHPAFSPDGHWMAYASQESGQFDVFVQSVPAGRGKLRISSTSGAQPTWRRDGRELFYKTGDGEIMAVPIAIGATLTAGVPMRLFRANMPGLFGVRRQYVVSPDGQQFLVNLVLSDRAPTILLQNWLTRPGTAR